MNPTKILTRFTLESWTILLCVCSSLSQTVFPTLVETPVKEPVHNGTFILTSPKTIQIGNPYLISGKAFQPISRLEVSIKDRKQKVISEKILYNVQAGQKIEFSLPTGQRPRKPIWRSFTLEANTYDSAGNKLASKKDYLSPSFFTESVFIQTDKAVYKPGSLVKYRVVVVDSNLKPVQGTISVKILDNKQNTLSQYLDVVLNKGVMSNEFQLSEEPSLGDYVLRVQTSSGTTIQRSFKVDKYVLPKFEVKVIPDKEKVLNTDGVKVKVQAKYTFGKGVEGNAIVTVGSAYRYYISRPRLENGRAPSRPRIGFPDPEKKEMSKLVNLDKSGEAYVTFTNQDLQASDLVNDWDSKINVSAVVTETLTSEERGGFAMVDLVKDAYRFKVEKTSQFFIPETEYKFSVSLVPFDDSAFPANGARSVTVNVTYSFKPENNERRSPWEYNPPKTTSSQFVLTLDRNGKGEIAVTPMKNVDNMAFQMFYNHEIPKVGQAIGHEYISASLSPSDSFLSVAPPRGSFEPGQTAVVQFSATEPIESVHAVAVAKGSLVYTVYDQLVGSTFGAINIPVLPSMAPRAKIVVYTMKSSNKEILADSVELRVNPGEGNKVEVTVNPPNAKPGDPVTVTVRSGPNAFVGLVAVDKSVKLMGKGNEINQNEIDKVADSRGIFPIGIQFRKKRSIAPFWGGGNNVQSVFRSANVAVLTDAWLYGDFPMPRGISFGGIRPEAAMVGAPVPAPPPAPNARGQGGAGAGFAGGADTAVRTRSVFPETWIWFDAISEFNGVTTMTSRAPDTITTWLASAFAINEQSGIGATREPTKFIVYQPFFIRANLPYSVKRGEELGLQVLVFNYANTPQRVAVTLEHTTNSGFDFLTQNSAPIKAGRGRTGYNTRTVTVGGSAGATEEVFFPIKPTKIGKIKLKLSAIGQGLADRIEKTLIVEPEGYTVEVNKPIAIDLSSQREFRDTVSLTIPRGIVPGSARGEVSVTGTVMGPAVANVKNLVKMPYGCGEQNMVGFVPNIVVLKFLRATGQLKPELEKEAKRNMEAGYQRELNYKRKDNSFSAFGDSDEAGSTWLTAFVMKSFAQAQKYIYIDEKVISKGLQYLREQQKRNGEFKENHEVIHSFLRGGSNKGVPLTAFVLIAFLQNQEKNQKAQELLEKSLKKVENDPYSLSIATYALHMANSPYKDEAFRLLEKAATVANGTKYWSDVSNLKEYEEDRPPFWSQPPSTDVEGTGYALLTYLMRKNNRGALPIVRWLTQQRNSNGGFTSTQDTVIALQGLGEFAEEAYKDGLDASIAISNGRDTKNFNVTHRNSIVQQKMKLRNPRLPINIYATGAGLVSAQVTLRYNTKQPKANDPFECNPMATPKSTDDITITMCCRNKQGDSGMAVMEVNALSGYVIDDTNTDTLIKIPDLQRVELDNGKSKANIYFNKIGKTSECFNLSSSKVYDVENKKPAQMALYSYYSPEKRIERDYSVYNTKSLYQSCPKCWESTEQSQNLLRGQQDYVWNPLTQQYEISNRRQFRKPSSRRQRYYQNRRFNNDRFNYYQFYPFHG